MITDWKDFDIFVEQDIAKTNVNSGMLRAQLTVLLTKNVVVYQTPVEEIQLVLKARYDVEYKPEDISDELNYMQIAEYEANRHVLESEDYFEGF